MPVGTFAERFVAQTVRLQYYGVVNSNAAVNLDQREWMVPDLLDEPALQSIAGLADAYARVEAAELYQAALTDPLGAAGDAMAMKLQSDYLAGQERAYRLRQMSPLRASLHASARRYAHGATGAGVFGRVASHIQDLLVAGSAGFRPPGV
jgi:hypothetical protein